MRTTPKTTATQKYLDDLQPGERYAAPPMTLTPEHFQQFSALSGDDHPIHSDDDYARRCGMPGAVAHGLHLLATGATGATALSDHIHDSTLAMLGTTARFLRPAVSGDVLHREVEVLATEPKGAERGLLRLRLRIHNQRGELLLEGEHQLLLRRRSAAADSDASAPASESAVVQASAADGIAVIRFNNPPMNTLAHTLRSGVLHALQRAIADATVKAIVLIGGGRAFCSGAEIREFNTPKAAISPNSRELIAAVEASPKPVIAALHGVAMGGGLELAMGCHWRVASPGTQLALPEVKLGILPGAGGTQRLPRALGVERALPLIMRGDVVKSEQVSGTLLVDALIEGDLLQGALAFTHRLLQEQAPALWLRRLRDQAASQADAADDEALFAAARQLAATTLHGYPAPAKIVDAVQASVQLPFEDGLKFERQCFEELVLTSESRALRHAFFGERTVARVPDLPTDLPADIASAAIEHVAVIGNGALAQHLAKQFTQAGLTVLHLDAPAQSLDAAIGRADLGRIDLAIEALPPSADAPNNNPAQALAARCQLLSALDARLPAQALIASHSTWLDLRVLAAATQRPQQVLGLNMVSPLWLAEEAGSMRLLEVVRTGNTAVSALLRVLQLAKRLRKLTVVERIGDEVVGNPAGGNQAGGNQAGAAVAAAVAAIGASMLRRYLQAGQDLLAGAAHATQIDAALQSWGMRLGPFALRQLAGEQLPASLRPAPDANRTNITNIPNAPDDAAIVRHCLEALIDEGRRLLHTGVALREVDIDMVCLHGYGFAPYRGGPMFQAAELGLRPEPGL